MDKTLIEQAASEAHDAMNSIDPMGKLIRDGLSRCHNDAIEAASSMAQMLLIGAAQPQELVNIVCAGIISLRTDVNKKPRP